MVAADSRRPAPAWRERLSLAVYSLLVRAATPLLRRKLRRRGKSEAGYLLNIDERFGRYPAALEAALAQRAWPRIWLHAVSLGETRAAGLLIAALRQRWPGMQLVLTSSTATGREEGLRHLRPGDVQLWAPWDTPQAVGRFVAATAPDLGLLMETEVWPNLMRTLAAHAVPTVLVNARLNEKSARGALRWPALMQPAYARFTRVLAQSPADAERLASVGATAIVRLGNLKYDAQPDLAQLALGRQWRHRAARPVVLFASSREGEEAALLQALQATPAAREAAQWLIVPRHPQRFDAVASLAQQLGWRVRRRSAGELPPPAAASDGDAGALADRRHADSATLWLGDSLGEMPLYYGLADLALLGGSFEPLGGQNLIEAAACGCPMLMGPHTFNFAQACEQAEAAGAALRVPDLDAAVAQACRLLAQPGSLPAMRAAAEGFVAASRGAVQATVEQLAELLDTASTPGLPPPH
ncbi:MAG: 3-deoxy-D-manno-octulosonic acid transferase [Comamonas sp.]